MRADETMIERQKDICDKGIYDVSVSAMTVLGFSMLFLSIFAPYAHASIIYVPDDYSKIQRAVDSAAAGDTIIVRDGVYVENININKQLTLRSENGSANCIVKAATYYDDVFHVTADYVNIYGFTIKGGYDGIYLYAENCNIANNKILDNWCGISLGGSSSNNITGNIISNNDCGIYLVGSSNIIITGNNISNNGGGICSWESSNNITGNIISNNEWYGIDLWDSRNNNITGNTMKNDGVSIWGYKLRHWNTHTIENNTVNGKPLYYFKNKSGGKVPEDAGQVILANCTGMLLENLIINNTNVGIEIGFSSQNIIKNNNVSNNRDGIYLRDSSSNNITGNDISNNIKYGIRLDDSSNNIIYLNNFINNTDSVDSYGSTNIWNSTSQIKYTYKGKTYMNYLGNYWSDYTGSDKNGDGIGDAPYIINGDRDNYPLIEPFENYFAQVEEFDTGAPSNPYPSISGIFKGTIKTKVTIEVSKIYTYACECTGGHTKYARIYNDTWSVETLPWEGYKGDWKNISFSETFNLYADVEYNITLITGSYPQIHHTRSLETENGWINCSEFVDANGNVYNDWIPAIKLYA